MGRLLRRTTVLCVIYASSLCKAEPPEGLELLATVVRPPPLPGQSVRVRLTLRNGAKEALGKLRPIEAGCFLTKVKDPGAADFRNLFDAGTADGPSYSFRPNSPTPQPTLQAFAAKLAKAEATLEPGKDITITGVFGSHRKEDGLFTQEGAYGLHFVYGNRTYRVDSDSLRVTVGKPTAADADAYQHVRKAGLYSALVWGRNEAVILDEKTAGGLRQLVLQYPKSSYADYARYLLALRHQFHKYDQHGNSLVTAKDYVEAEKLLREINFKEFAWGAEVLIWLKNVTKDAAKAKEYEERLRADFYDSFEWMEELSKTHTYAQLLEARKPAKAGK